MAVCSLLPGLWYIQRKRKESKSPSWASKKESETGGLGISARKNVDINGMSIPKNFDFPTC